MEFVKALKMKNGIVMAALLLALFACKKDDEEPAPTYKTSVKAGDFEDALFYSNLSEDDSVIRDDEHISLKELDADADGVMDLRIISIEDTLRSSNDAPAAHRKYLALQPINPAQKAIFVTTENRDIRKYTKGYELSYERGNWLQLVALEAFFCFYEQNLSSEEELILGYWNNSRDRYFASYVEKEDHIVLTWYHISVLDYDNYVYHNHASHILSK